jgi:hypothetical protein
MKVVLAFAKTHWIYITGNLAPVMPRIYNKKEGDRDFNYAGAF